MNYLALALWPIGEIRRAQELESAALARAHQTGHVATLAYAASYRSIFEMMRLDARAADHCSANFGTGTPAWAIPVGRLCLRCQRVGSSAVGDRGQGIAKCAKASTTSDGKALPS